MDQDPRIDSGANSLSSLQSQNSPSLITIDPVQQLKIFWRYKVEIIGLTLLSILISIFLVYSMTPTYRSTVTLLIEPKDSNVANIKKVYENDPWTYAEYQQTQHEVLRSRRIAERIVDKLDLVNHPEFKVAQKLEAEPSRFQKVIDLVRNSFGTENKPDTIVNVDQDALRSSVVKSVMARIKVQPLINTHIVNVHATAKDAELSAEIANNVVISYINSEFESRQGISEKATGLLTTRLEELKKQLQNSEKKLQAFYESEQLVNVGGTRGLSEEEISDNSRRLRDANKVKTELKNVYEKIVQANNQPELLQEITAIQQDSLVQSTKRSYLTASENVSELESRYGPKHPKMVAAQARLKEASDSYRRQLKVSADGIRSQFQNASSTVNVLAGTVAASREQIQKMDRNQYQLELLQHEVKSNRDLYDSFLTRYKETDAASNLDIGNARIIDAAVIPTRPYKPRKKLWVVSAALLGLLLGLALALLRSFLDNTIKSPSDLERITGIPVISILPFVKGGLWKTPKVARLELDEPNSVFSEGIRTLRTSLMLSDLPTKRKRILITSSIPSEGKTSTSVNLAIALAQTEKVLLIEGDLRRPSISSYLEVPNSNESGLAKLLTGDSVIVKDCVYRFEAGKLDVLPCGQTPANPSELLGSPQFAKLLDKLGGIYDRIIIDSPPCQVVSDALLLARISDGIVFLAKADSTHSRIVTAAIRQLRTTKTPILGAVLNQANLRKNVGYGSDDFYYYYPEYYGASSKS